MIKNLAEAVPAAYMAPSVAIVEMEIDDTILVVSGEDGGYTEETWN